jgi:hypothetical protein
MGKLHYSQGGAIYPNFESALRESVKLSKLFAEFGILEDINISANSKLQLDGTDLEDLFGINKAGETILTFQDLENLVNQGVECVDSESNERYHLSFLNSSCSLQIYLRSEEEKSTFYYAVSFEEDIKRGKDSEKYINLCKSLHVFIYDKLEEVPKEPFKNPFDYDIPTLDEVKLNG